MEEWRLALQILSVSSRDGSNSCKNRDNPSYLRDEGSFLVVVRYCWKAVSNNCTLISGGKRGREDLGRFMVS